MPGDGPAESSSVLEMEPGLLYLSPYGHAVKQGSLDTPNSLAYPKPNPATQDGSPHAMRPLREGLLLWDWASQIAELRELFRRGVRLTRPAEFSGIS